jgi:hypothetical protein
MVIWVTMAAIAGFFAGLIFVLMAQVAPPFFKWMLPIHGALAGGGWAWMVWRMWLRYRGVQLFGEVSRELLVLGETGDLLPGPLIVVGWDPGAIGARAFVLRPGKLGRPELGNVLVIGSTRCGKGLWAALQMAAWNAGPVVAVDVKGGMDYTLRALPVVRSWGYEVHYTHLSGGVGVGFDPVAWVRDPIRIASMFQDLFAVGRGERWDSVFREAGAALATAVAVWALDRGIPFVEALKEALALGPSEWIRRAMDSGAASQVVRAASLAGVGVRDLTPGVMQRTLLQHGWSDMANRLRGLLDRDGMVKGVPEAFEGERWAWIIAVDQADLEALRSVVQLWMWALLNEIASRRDRRPGLPMLVVIDEAAAVGVPGLPRWYATLAGRQVSIVSIWQTIGQIVGTYGQDGMSELVGNSTVILVAGGNPDVHTVKWASEVLGAHEVWVPSVHERGLLDWGRSYAQQVWPWARPDEISRERPEVWFARVGVLRGKVVRIGALDVGLEVLDDVRREIAGMASGRRLEGSWRPALEDGGVKSWLGGE